VTGVTGVTGVSQVSFEVSARDGPARTGVLRLGRGTVLTPAFMPVGTAGTVKAMFPADVRAAGCDIILANTYHLMLRPGAERLARLGGLHKFMDWPHPILTDSGGFQVMSLASLRKITEQGVTFRSHIDGSEHALGPERAMEIQHLIGSDIHMVLDECIPWPAAKDEAERAMELSLRWAGRSKAAFAAAPDRALFAIVQGGTHKDLRRRSAEALAALGFDGYAIGGLAVGEGQALMLETIEATVAHLPDGAPRYLMGVGTPEDITRAVARGIDMFDCVMPTRSGRHGQAFTHLGRLNLTNARFADDDRPLDPEGRSAAARVSRAYYHHLFRAGEILGMMHLTAANLAYYQELMAELRAAIAAGRLAGVISGLREGWARGGEG
jgi:queuine tRNA-ribosyltransferase